MRDESYRWGWWIARRGEAPIVRVESKAAQTLSQNKSGIYQGVVEAHGCRFPEPTAVTRIMALVRRGQPQPPPYPVPLPPAPFLAHPYPLQQGFTGRIRERQMLTRWFLSDQQPLLALIAPAGMGKSALVWTWLCHDVLGWSLPGLGQDPPELSASCRVPEDRRPEGVVWWAFSNPRAGFDSFLDRVLIYVSDGLLEPSSISSNARGREVVEWLQHRRLLLVLDGVDRELRAYVSLSAVYSEDPVTEGEGEESRTCVDLDAGRFLRWLALSPLESRVVITSRLLPAELDDLTGCRREELNPLSPDDALTFLRSQGLRGTQSEIEAVSRLGTGHPLALRLWAGMIAYDPDWPVDMISASRYCHEASKHRKEHTILALAYKALPGPLRELLGRMAVSRSPMDYPMATCFSPFTGNRRLGLALNELDRRGLILFSRETGQYDLPPMVRAYAYRRLTHQERESIHQQLRGYFAAMLPSAPGPAGALEDLAPAIELYHHTVCLGQYDEAAVVFLDRLREPLCRLGAYRNGIDLLQALFPRGTELLPDPATARRKEGAPSRLPHVQDIRVQAQVLYTLADFYTAWGQPRQAVPFLQVHNALQERLNHPRGMAEGLEMLAEVQFELGELAEAERNWKRVIRYSRETGDQVLEARVRARLGRLLGYRGALDQADRELEAASAVQPENSLIQAFVHLHRAHLALVRMEPEKVLEETDTVLQLIEETANDSAAGHLAHDLAWTCWLLGAAHLILGNLPEAEAYLNQASDVCHDTHRVELEPDILLAWARWYQAKEDQRKARECAEEALSLATRSEYRLKEAEIHNYLGRWELQMRDLDQARQHAETARERAWCDGPPYCYELALAAAERLLKLVSSR